MTDISTKWNCQVALPDDLAAAMLERLASSEKVSSFRLPSNAGQVVFSFSGETCLPREFFAFLGSTFPQRAPEEFAAKPKAQDLPEGETLMKFSSPNPGPRPEEIPLCQSTCNSSTGAKTSTNSVSPPKPSQTEPKISMSHNSGFSPILIQPNTLPVSSGQTRNETARTTIRLSGVPKPLPQTRTTRNKSCYSQFSRMERSHDQQLQCNCLSHHPSAGHNHGRYQGHPYEYCWVNPTNSGIFTSVPTHPVKNNAATPISQESDETSEIRQYYNLSETVRNLEGRIPPGVPENGRLPTSPICENHLHLRENPGRGSTFCPRSVIYSRNPVETQGFGIPFSLPGKNPVVYY
jgi:hypothetical protein